MASLEELHARLNAVSGRLQSTRAKVELKRGPNDGRNRTSGELVARDAFLKDALEWEVSDLKTHDHRASALEQHATNWIKNVALGRG